MPERTTGVGSEGNPAEELQNLSEKQPDLFHLLLEVKNYAGVAVMMTLLTLILTSGAFAADQNTNEDLGLDDNPHALVTPTAQFHEYLPLVVRRLNPNDHATPTFAPPNPTAPTSTAAPPNPFTSTSTLTPNPTSTTTAVPSPTNTSLSTATSTPRPTNTLRPTGTPTASPTATVERPTPTSSPTVTIVRNLDGVVSLMDRTKDRVCNQESREFFQRVAAKLAELGVLHLKVSVPLDTIPCDDSGTDYAGPYRTMIIDTFRHQNTVNGRPMGIWHDGTFSTFEKIYGRDRDIHRNYPQMIYDHIVTHRNEYKAGDLFTFPEPSNAGIYGVTYCDGECMFASIGEYNEFLRDVISKAKQAFRDIGLNGQVGVRCYGDNAYLYAGLDNGYWEPLHHSFIDQKTIDQAGGIVMDDYPPEGGTMASHLQRLRLVHPDARISIGETGSIHGINGGQTLDEILTALEQDGNIGEVAVWQAFGDPYREGLLYEDDNGFLHETANFPVVKRHFARR